jgi:hypothetical protein
VLTVPEVINELHRRGIALRVESDRIIAQPLNAVPSELREAARLHKEDLLAYLRREGGVTRDSRHPLVSAEIRQKIEAIEADARAKGWPAKLLRNAGFWDCPRGLAAVLDPEDEIADVAADCITILKSRGDLLKFPRYAA